MEKTINEFSISFAIIIFLWFSRCTNTGRKLNTVTALNRLRGIVVVTPNHSRMNETHGDKTHTHTQKMRETGKREPTTKSQPSLLKGRKKKKNGFVFYYSSVNTWPEARYNGTWCYSSSLLLLLLLFLYSFLFTFISTCWLPLCLQRCNSVAVLHSVRRKTHDSNNINMRKRAQVSATDDEQTHDEEKRTGGYTSTAPWFIIPTRSSRLHKLLYSADEYAQASLKKMCFEKIARQEEEKKCYVDTDREI